MGPRLLCYSSVLAVSSSVRRLLRVCGGTSMKKMKSQRCWFRSGHSRHDLAAFASFSRWCSPEACRQKRSEIWWAWAAVVLVVEAYWVVCKILNMNKLHDVSLDILFQLMSLQYMFPLASAVIEVKWRKLTFYWYWGSFVHLTDNWHIDFIVIFTFRWEVRVWEGLLGLVFDQNGAFRFLRRCWRHRRLILSWLSGALNGLLTYCIFVVLVLRMTRMMVLCVPNWFSRFVCV